MKKWTDNITHSWMLPIKILFEPWSLHNTLLKNKANLTEYYYFQEKMIVRTITYVSEIFGYDTAFVLLMVD